MTNDRNQDNQVLREVQKLAVAIAVLDERLKNHLEKSEEIQVELKLQETKIEEINHLVVRHSLFFRAFAWCLTMCASGLGIKHFIS